MTSHSRPQYLRSITIALTMTLMVLASATAESPADEFKAYSQGSSVTIDHSAWGTLLGIYIDDAHPSGINLFDYAAVSAADRGILDSYLNRLQQVDVAGMDKDEQMAYWINFYNALTIKVILDHYPVDSIKDISLPGSRGGPWKASLVTVQGVDLSLNDIEHGILRPIWGDPRIHYAVNCASIGCPNLASKPYTGENLDTMLNDAARSYVNHPRGVERDGRRLKLSSIYNWYKKDFGNRDELKAHLLQYADPKTAEDIRGASGSFKYDYDWDLNETK